MGFNYNDSGKAPSREISEFRQRIDTGHLTRAERRGRRRPYKKSRRKLLIAFCALIAAGYTGLAVHLLTTVPSDQIRRIGSVLIGGKKALAPVQRVSPPGHVTQTADLSHDPYAEPVYNCNGTYTNDPGNGGRCYPVKVVERAESWGYRYFSADTWSDTN